MDYLKMCEKMYKGFKKAGRPGIESIRDSGAYWVVMPASTNSSDVEYGMTPYIVEKNSGKTRCFSPVDEEDWMIIDNATPLEIPERFRASYN